MRGFQRFISSVHTQYFDSDPFESRFDNGKVKSSWRLEASTFYRVSTALLILSAVAFTLSRMLAWPLAATATAEAWLEDGEPVWRLSPASEDAPAKQFFMDLASSAKAISSSTDSRRSRHLERKGWNGVCSMPLAGDIGDRTCKQLVLPIAGEDYEKVTVPDCGPPSWGPMRLIQKMMGPAECPEVTLPAVGISTLLERVDAPKVIDFVSLQTGTPDEPVDLSILNNFPFSQYCVRAWTVRHGGNRVLMDAIRTILQVSHGCHLYDGSHIGGDETWARCPCKDGAQTQADSQAGALAAEDALSEELDSTQGSKAFLDGGS